MQLFERPLLSIMIPTWNRVDSVVRAVQSIGDFSEHLEVIVVDNGSDEVVFSRLEIELRQFFNVKLYRNEQNIGMVKNWNRCIANATGIWQGLLCSDDYYSDGAIKRVCALIRTLQAPCLIIQDSAIAAAIQHHPPGCDTLRTLRLPLASGNFWHSECIDALGGFDERFEYSADAEYWPRLASCFPVIKVREAFACYEQHKNNYMWSTWLQDDFLTQMELLARTVLAYIYGSKETNRLLIDHELEAAMWSTLLTITQSSFLNRSHAKIFLKYFPETLKRATTLKRKIQLLKKLFLAVGNIPMIRAVHKKCLLNIRCQAL